MNPINAYPDKPPVAYRRTSVTMTNVEAYLRGLTVPTAVKCAAYVIFRNESANGASGVNNNYAGAQADGARWPAQFDAKIVGVVTEAENGTGRTRLFCAFASWTDSVDLLIYDVTERGLYVGGTTHEVVRMVVSTPHDLAAAYYKEWVTGSVSAVMSTAALASFSSMYAQAETLFGTPAKPVLVQAARQVFERPVAKVPTETPSTADLNDASLAGGTFPMET